MKRNKFLHTLRNERQHFEELLAQVGSEHMEVPGVSGDYSLKDIVAHVTVYERALVQWLDRARVGKVYIDPIVDQRDVHARNAQIYAFNKDRSPEEVLADFKSTYDALEAAVEKLTNEELNDETLTAWFVEPRWGGARPLWQCIALDSYEHHNQHIPDMERWLSK